MIHQGHPHRSWALGLLGALLVVASTMLPALARKATADKVAKLGFEYEDGLGFFSASGVSKEERRKLKGAKVQPSGLRRTKHSGQGWYLSVDTTLAGDSDDYQKLVAEWITLCELEDERELGQIATAVKADMDYLVKNSGIKQYKIEGSDKKWNNKFPIITTMEQVTAPMPLEGIQDVFEASYRGSGGPQNLVSVDRKARRNMVWVTKDFFQSRFIKGLASGDDRYKDLKDPLAWVTQDVLGFFSLVLSFAKTAFDLDSFGSVNRRSIKTMVPIMPRNDWTTVYEQVKERIPSGRLWDLVNVLACYKRLTASEISIDNEYCGGTLEEPEVGPKLAQQEWKTRPVKGEDRAPKSLSNKRWIDSMAAGEKPDAMTVFDKLWFNGQIGFFEADLELVLGTTTEREVPLWEFRANGEIKAWFVINRMWGVRGTVVDLHHKYPDVPQIESS